MDNAVFQKNVRKQRDIKLVATERRINYLVSEQNYHTAKFFTKNLLAIEKKKTQIFMTLGLSKLTLICLGGGGVVVVGGNMTPPHHPQSCGFLKNVFSKGRVKSWFFVTFNINSKHIFSENFIEFPQVVQKIGRNSLSILAIFIIFPQFYGFFDITLLQRNQ